MYKFFQTSKKNALPEQTMPSTPKSTRYTPNLTWVVVSPVKVDIGAPLVSKMSTVGRLYRFTGLPFLFTNKYKL